MNVVDMLFMKVTPLYDAERTAAQQSYQEKCAELFTARAEQRYRNALSEGRVRSSAEIGKELGLTKASAYLNVLEKKGLVQRVGLRPTGGSNPTILWKWIGD